MWAGLYLLVSAATRKLAYQVLVYPHGSMRRFAARRALQVTLRVEFWLFQRAHIQ